MSSHPPCSRRGVPAALGQISQGCRRISGEGRPQALGGDLVAQQSMRHVGVGVARSAQLPQCDPKCVAGAGGKAGGGISETNKVSGTFYASVHSHVRRPALAALDDDLGRHMGGRALIKVAGVGLLVVQLEGQAEICQLGNHATGARGVAAQQHVAGLHRQVGKWLEAP